MTTALTLKEKQLESELRGVRELKEKEAHNELLQKNYKEWVERKPLWLLGKAYCTPNKSQFSDDRPIRSLQIGVHVPGNCSRSYEVSKQVPAAVVTYFHNIFSEPMRQKLQKGINDVVESVVNEFLNNPKCVLDMIGLQGDDYYLRRSQHYPPELIEDMEKEIEEERYKVIDRFKEDELIPVVGDLSHSNGILYGYAQSRGLKKLIAAMQKEHSWAR